MRGLFVITKRHISKHIINAQKCEINGIPSVSIDWYNHIHERKLRTLNTENIFKNNDKFKEILSKQNNPNNIDSNEWIKLSSELHIKPLALLRYYLLYYLNQNSYNDIHNNNSSVFNPNQCISLNLYKGYIKQCQNYKHNQHYCFKHKHYNNLNSNIITRTINGFIDELQLNRKFKFKHNKRFNQLCNELIKLKKMNSLKCSFDMNNKVDTIMNEITKLYNINNKTKYRIITKKNISQYIKGVKSIIDSNPKTMKQKMNKIIRLNLFNFRMNYNFIYNSIKIIKYDKTKTSNFEKTQRRSSKIFEYNIIKEFKHIFKSLKLSNINMKREKELIKENYKITPDILFDEPIKINNTIINWIEIKNFTIYGMHLYNELIKQCNKYTEKYKNGAIISRGFEYDSIKNIHSFKDVLFLDGSLFPYTKENSGNFQSKKKVSIK